MRGAWTLRRRGWSLAVRPRAAAAGSAIALAGLAAAVVSIGTGEFPMGPGQVLRTLAGAGTPAEAFVVDQLRLPRVLTALLAGAALALSGAVFQSLVRNPLGSPDVLGFSQGAATGALAAITIGGGAAGAGAVAGGAAAGGIATGTAVWLLTRRTGSQGTRLVLTGIGVSAVATGITGYLLTRAQLLDAARAVRWITGSLDGRGWSDVLSVGLPLVLLGGPVLACAGRTLRGLELGDDAAYGLGVRVERARGALLAAAVLLAAAATAACGPVAFVALTAPQLARRLTRAPGPNLAASALTGAALLTVADLLAQRIAPGRELPVGALTGVLGGGYLVGLLWAERRRGRI
ncbi:FecCD family ABC transporter permease [Phaeacidiphilus oryzae]|uniref:FecCD family ABC transporter permease n=1 Tax=Phaeacidiphilus oryzae TaxID=348818 RepID=UPI000566E593|nr:iron chelate uptake ABC transporter family permease subunit [Phaeacidiphilus oryzae]